MWQYRKGTDRVATLYDQFGTAVLDVYSNAKAYVSIPYPAYLNSFSVPYEQVNTQTEVVSATEAVEKRVKAACALIEKNYEEQVKHMQKAVHAKRD